MPVSIVTNEDNMAMMSRYPDKFFELAVVDPPYGINIGKSVGGAKPFGKKGTIQHGVGLSKTVKPKIYTAFDDSLPPPEAYFKELIRVSKNQIIWGGNYFTDKLPPSQCWICWDKNKSGFFADGELAWTSFDSAMRIFKYTWNGMLQADMKNKEHRIHPTQKPVALYSWILKNFAKKGFKILDTHRGSDSNRIACYDAGFDFYGCELIEQLHNDANERFNRHISQVKPFDIVTPQKEQTHLF